MFKVLAFVIAWPFMRPPDPHNIASPPSAQCKNMRQEEVEEKLLQASVDKLQTGPLPAVKPVDLEEARLWFQKGLTRKAGGIVLFSRVLVG